MKKTLFFVMMMVALGSKAQVDLYNGLIAYYPFDGNTNDASGNGHNGTMVGGGYASGVFGNPNTALSIPDGVTFDAEIMYKTEDEFSFSFWFIGNFTTTSGSVISWIGKNQPTNNYDLFRFRYQYPPSSIPVFRSELFKSSNTSQQNCDTDFYDFSPSLITDPLAYQHIALVRSSDSLYVYLNNVKLSVVEATFTGCNDIDSLKSLRLGGPIFFGEIDDLLIYNRALNESEVDSIYNLSSSLPAVIPSSSNQLLEKNVNIYPNPFDNLANISFPENGIYNIQVVDMTGRLIYTAQVSDQNLQLNTSSWAAGMYRLNILNENGQFESKTIVKE
jgi:hypothetical protein